MFVKTTKHGFKVRFFQVNYTILRNEKGFEIDENSPLWKNYRERFFIPGIRITKIKTEKLYKDFKWDVYKIARLFFNEHSNTWGLYGVCMKDKELIFRKICSIRKDQLIRAFGPDWEEKYWEEIFKK
jgi:hypothetical protein